MHKTASLITRLPTRFGFLFAVRAADPVVRRRGQLLAVFLVGACVSMLLLTSIDLAEIISGYTPFATFLMTDLFTLAMMSGVYWLNRQGRVQLAALVSIGLIIFIPALLIPLDTLNNSLVIFTLPIALASFVLFPAASLGAAALALVLYLGLNVAQQSGSPFNYLGVLAVLILAVTTWMVADWLQRTLQQANESQDQLRADIARRETIEAALAASEERLQTVIANNVDGLIVVNQDDVVRFANPTAAALLGRSLSELIDHELKLPATRQPMIELSVFSANGQVTTLEVRTARIEWEGWPAMLASLRDVTARRQAEDALRASEERFRNLVQNLGEGVGIVDLDERFLFANRMADNIFGVGPGQLIGRTLSEFISVEQLRVLQTQTERRRRGESSSYEMEITRPDGEQRNILITGTPQRHPDGSFGGTLGIFFDITERKRAEEQIANLNRVLEQRVIERTGALAALNLELNREIADRKQIEQALRLSEDQLRTVSEASPVPLIITRLSDTIILSANHPICEMFRLPRERLVGQPARLYFHNQREFRRLVLEVHRRGEVNSAEVQAIRADGTLFWVLVSIRPLVYNGEPALVSGFTDVTERKQAEQIVRDSEMKFRSIIEQSRDGIVLADDHGVIVEWNYGMETITGWHRSAMLGCQLKDTPLRVVMNVDSTEVGSAALRSGLNATLDHPSLSSMYQLMEHDFIRADGVRRSMQIMFFPIRLERTMMFCAISRDVTERRQAEAALRDSEIRFRQMAENIREVFWMSSPEKGQMLYVSPAYEETWGRSCESLYADPLSFAEAVYPDDRPVMADFLARQQRGETAFAEYRITRPDGTIGWIWDRAFPICDEAGRVYRVVGVAEDITERRRAEQELRQALSKEKELVELKSRFISMATHEFRTPLTGILSSAELLEHYGDKWPVEKKQRYLTLIQSRVMAMTRLLEDVLTIGRHEADRMEFAPAPLQLERLCRELIEEAQLIDHTQHPVHLTVHLRDEAVVLDERLVRQIVGNLLSNALKYSPMGLPVNVALELADGLLTIRVSDNGIGIPAGADEHLFESFYRAANVGGVPGTGLGLAIVKKSVELHGGAITYLSEAGHGTTFTVTLPILPPREINHDQANTRC